MADRTGGELWQVASQFEIGAAAHAVTPLGSGHIHETFCIGSPGGPRFALQRVNVSVFRDAEALVMNLAAVTQHVREALGRRGDADLERRCLRITPTRDGAPTWRDETGSLWRCFPFVEGTHSFDTASHPRIAREVARSFGDFAALLADLRQDSLRDTIPHFHDLPRYGRALDAAVRADPHGRASAVAAEIELLRENLHRFDTALREVAAESLPSRIMHNDCKINNVLMDTTTDEALCVIDLDTVMVDTVLSDFGQLIRTATCTAPEDERDLSRIGIETPWIEAVTEGYLAGAGPMLSDHELATLPLAGPTSALENAVRFLTDHLEGDSYFRIARTGQNLDRSRAQACLFERLMEARDAVAASLSARETHDGARDQND